MAALQFIAVVALGLVVSWLAHQWLDLFQNKWVAGIIWISACLLYGAIYDWNTARRARGRQDLLPPHE